MVYRQKPWVFEWSYDTTVCFCFSSKISFLSEPRISTYSFECYILHNELSTSHSTIPPIIIKNYKDRVERNISFVSPEKWPHNYANCTDYTAPVIIRMWRNIFVSRIRFVTLEYNAYTVTKEARLQTVVFFEGRFCFSFPLTFVLPTLTYLHANFVVLPNRRYVVNRN